MASGLTLSLLAEFFFHHLVLLSESGVWGSISTSDEDEACCKLVLKSQKRTRSTF